VATRICCVTYLSVTAMEFGLMFQFWSLLVTLASISRVVRMDGMVTGVLLFLLLAQRGVGAAFWPPTCPRFHPPYAYFQCLYG